MYTEKLPNGKIKYIESYKDTTTAAILRQFKRDEWEENRYNRLFIRVTHLWLNRLVKKLTKTSIHIHSLRHTYASYLIAQEIELLTVSKLLGHKDLTVTLQTYPHQLEARKEDDFEEIKKLFGGGFGARNFKTLLNKGF